MVFDRPGRSFKRVDPCLQSALPSAQMTVAATSSPSRAESCPHLVQLYRDGEEIAATVAEFFSEGLSAGEPAIAIATDEHLTLFADRLRDRGYDSVELQEQGMLLLADAEATLSSLLDNGAPSP